MKLRNGQTVSKPYNDSYCLTLKSFFIPLRCRMCLDLFSSRADASFGDAWLPDRLRNDSQGTSLLVIRSPEIQILIDKMAREGRICLQQIEESEVMRSQEYYRYKTRTIGSAMLLFWMLHRKARSSHGSFRQKVGLLQYSLFFVLHIVGSAPQSRFQYPMILAFTRVIETAKRVRGKLKD